MEYVTTTGLRTQSPQVVRLLRKGESISLIHRSEIIGTISPDAMSAPVATPEKLTAFFTALRPKTLVPKVRRMSVYRDRLLKKYGKNIS